MDSGTEILKYDWFILWKLFKNIIIVFKNTSYPKYFTDDITIDLIDTCVFFNLKLNVFLRRSTSLLSIINL